MSVDSMSDQSKKLLPLIRSASECIPSNDNSSKLGNVFSGGWRFGFSFLKGGGRVRSHSHSQVLPKEESRDRPEFQAAKEFEQPEDLQKKNTEGIINRQIAGIKFKRRVCFDTFHNKQASEFVLTLRARHQDYIWSKSSRTFLCGLDRSEHSELALEWLLESLVEDGDEVIALRVVETSNSRDSAGTDNAADQASDYILEAESILQDVLLKNSDQKAISVVVEFAMSKVQSYIQKTIYLYSPDSLIVSTRGKGIGFQSLRSGSISKYCLQHSPVPVIVVRPDSKRSKSKLKRMEDPNRRSYIDMIEVSVNRQKNNANP